MNHRKPTPTPRQPAQVRCPHPTSTRRIDFGWLETRITSRDELFFREFPQVDPAEVGELQEGEEAILGRLPWPWQSKQTRRDPGRRGRGACPPDRWIGSGGSARRRTGRGVVDSYRFVPARSFARLQARTARANRRARSVIRSSGTLETISSSIPPSRHPSWPRQNVPASGRRLLPSRKASRPSRPPRWADDGA